MNEYVGTVVFRYYKTIRVQAESLEEAEREMYSKFDLSKAEQESEVFDVCEVPKQTVEEIVEILKGVEQ